MLQSANECIEYIHSLSKFGKKAGLSNTERILERLGNPHKKLKFIHVAGTNGKGSVSNMINNILISAGYKVGYYTSPYIEFFNERICINNKMIPDEKLVEYTNKVANAIEGISPIEFEFITSMAMLYFLDSLCDIVVLEVGLGGRFDATNVIDTPELNVISKIGLDHVSILGDTIDKIAYEKAGTIKEGSSVVLHPETDIVSLAVIRDKCRATHSSYYLTDDIAKDVVYGMEYTDFIYKNEHYKLSLKGKYQIGNAICAIEAAEQLSKKWNIDRQNIRDGLANSHWKCRFEIFSNELDVVLDGAHNLQGVKALMESANEYFNGREKIFVFSMLNEKDYKKSIEAILPTADFIIATSVPSLRQTDASIIYDEIKKHTDKCVFESEPTLALKKAIDMAKKGGAVVFVFGSLYLSGILRRYVK